MNAFKIISALFFLYGVWSEILFKTKNTKVCKNMLLKRILWPNTGEAACRSVRLRTEEINNSILTLVKYNNYDQREKN